MSKTVFDGLKKKGAKRPTSNCRFCLEPVVFAKCPKLGNIALDATVRVYGYRFDREQAEEVSQPCGKGPSAEYHLALHEDRCRALQKNHDEVKSLRSKVEAYERAEALAHAALEGSQDPSVVVKASLEEPSEDTCECGHLHADHLAGGCAECECGWL